MLACRQLVELVTDYLEGALDAAVAKQVTDHLAGCADCRRYVEQVRETARALAGLPAPELSPAVCAELLAAFHARPAGGT